MNKFIPALVITLAGLGQMAVAADDATAKAADAGPAVAAKAAATATPAAPAAAEIPADVATTMNKLVEKAIQVAAEPLQKSDQFTPYGVLLMADGTMQAVNYTKPNPPAPIEIFRQINLAIRAKAASDPNIVAAVTVAPTSVPTTDGAMRVNGIRAEVDHRRGAPRLVFIPYTRVDGKLVLGTTVYQPGVNPVFDRSQPAAAPAAGKAAVPAKAAAAKGPGAKKAPAAKGAPAKGAPAKAAPAKAAPAKAAAPAAAQ